MLFRISERDVDRIVHDITRLITLIRKAELTDMGYALSACEKELEAIREDLLEALDGDEDCEI